MTACIIHDALTGVTKTPDATVKILHFLGTNPEVKPFLGSLAPDTAIVSGTQGLVLAWLFLTLD